MRRNTEQNRMYWSLVHLVAEKIKPNGQTFSPDSWHLFLKSRFLGCDDERLPNGKVLTIPKSSADLDVAEFSAFLDQVQAWAAERDVYLEDRTFA